MGGHYLINMATSANWYKKTEGKQGGGQNLHGSNLPHCTLL